MDAKDKVIAKIQATAGKTASARERHQKKGNATGYVSIWNDAVMDLYGKEHCVPPTQKISGMLLKALKRLPNQQPAHLKMFISWVIEEWPRLAGPNKKWGDIPDMGSFVYGVPRLYSDYCRKDQTKIRLSGSKKSSAAGDAKLSKLESEVRRLNLELVDRDREILQLKSRLEMLSRRR
jgi:hypothetical protein